MSVQAIPLQTRATAATASGVPLPGAKIYTYETGTTTPLTTYQNEALSIVHANPIIAGSDGTYGPIWTNGLTAVKVVITTSADATVDTIDPLPLCPTDAGVGNVYWSSTAMRVYQNTTNAPGNSNTTTGHVLDTNGQAYHSTNTTLVPIRANINGDGTAVSLRRSGTQVGSISVSAGATAYNTSSDYRLKYVLPIPESHDAEAILADLGARLKWYEFKDGGRQELGWLAHELAEVMPLAVTGEKDGAEMQGVDKTTLIPVIVAALASALARIDALEAA